ncbi:MAG: hypothetical protein ACJ8FY_19545 [Gemmataceae bacterium]
MPNWTYLPIDDEHTTISLSPGKWLVTDGAHFTKDTVEVGHITASDGFLDLSQTPEGLELLTFAFKTETPVGKRTDNVLVIDSGGMVLCCEDASGRAG